MRRVLAVDDDPSILAVIKDILLKSGYTVVVVPNGVEALRRMDGDSFDLVITDLRMPEISGMDLLARVRAERLPVGMIVLTASNARSSTLPPVKGCPRACATGKIVAIAGRRGSIRPPAACCARDRARPSAAGRSAGSRAARNLWARLPAGDR